LSECRRDFETLVEDDLLALKANIGGPFDVSNKVALRLNIATNAKVFGCSFEEWVLLLLGLLCSKRSWSGGF